jgi:apolipoprotein N-acyltransferase
VGYYCPWPVPFLCAFLPLLYCVERFAQGTERGAFRAGFVFGVVTHLIGLHFWYAALHITWLVAVLYLGLVVLFALKIAVSISLLCWLRRRTGWSYGILLPVCWLPFEWLSTIGDLRMTADHLAHGMTGMPSLIQFADLFGHYGVSCFVLVVNGLLFATFFESKRSARRYAAASLALLLVAVAAYDAWAWFRPEPELSSTRVALIQPDISFEMKDSSQTSAQAQWDTLNRLTREGAAQGAKLIIWPESSRPWPIYHVLQRPDTYAMNDVENLARELGVSILVGVEYYKIRSKDDYESYNAAMVVNEQGILSDIWAAKSYLVPFAEALPYRRFLGPLFEGRRGENWRWILGTFYSGPRTVLLEAAGARVGLLVCYEQLYPDLARDLDRAGADYQVVITNDVWWGRSLFQGYQADALRLRAIENRTEIVRVANNGISGFVDSRGRYHQRTPLFESRVEVRDVTHLSRPTLAARVGDLIVWLALAVLAMGVIVARLKTSSRHA